MVPIQQDAPNPVWGVLRRLSNVRCGELAEDADESASELLDLTQGQVPRVVHSNLVSKCWDAR